MSISKLVDMEIDKVAGVDKAANGKKFLIIKRADQNDEVKITPKELADQIVKAGRTLSKDNLETLMEAHNNIMQMLMNAGVDPYSIMDEDGLYKKESDMMKMMSENDFMALEQNDMWNQYKKAMELLQEKMEEMEKMKNMKEYDEVEKKNKSVDELIKMDNLPSEVREQLKKQKEMETRLEKMEAERLEKKYSDEASEFSNLANDDLKDILKFVGESNQDLHNKLTGVLKSANNAIEKGDLFKEAGKEGAEVTGDAIAKMNAARDEIMKAEGLSKEKAFMKAMQMNPGLYEQYEKELGGNK